MGWKSYRDQKRAYEAANAPAPAAPPVASAPTKSLATPAAEPAPNARPDLPH
jgi:hypothetical protein